MRNYIYISTLFVFGFANASLAQVPETDAPLSNQTNSLTSQFEQFEIDSKLSLTPSSSAPVYLKELNLSNSGVSADAQSNIEPDYLNFDGIEKSSLTDKDLQKMRYNFGIRTNKKEDPRYKPVLRIQAGDDKLEIK